MPEEQVNKNYNAIMEYLEMSYAGARAMNDVETMCRLSRAIIAFSYDDLEHMPTWEEMSDAFMKKDSPEIE
jgi:hypothetical protein